MGNYEIFLRNIGQSGQGLDMLKNVISTSSGKEKIDAVITLANLYFSDDKYSQAVDLLENEINVCEDSGQIIRMRSFLASIYKKRGDFDSAIKIFEQQRKEKDSAEMIAFHVESLMNGGYSEKAQNLLEEMEKKYPEDVNLYLLKAKYALTETEYDKAVEYADQALKLASGNASAYKIKAQALLNSDKMFEAEEAVNELIKASGEIANDGRVLLAQIYWHNNQFEQAIIELRKGLEVEPGHIQLNALLVEMLKNRKRWNELIGYYQQRIDNYPNLLSLYSQYALSIMEWADELARDGNSMVAGEKLNDALEKLDVAVKIAVNNKQSLSTLVDTRTSVMIKMGMYNQVITELRSNPEIIKSSPSLELKFAEALYATGQKNEAFASLDNILNADLNSMALEIMLERIIRIFSSDELIAWVDSVAENNQNKGFLYLIKASSLKLKGDNDQFISAIEKSVEESSAQPGVQLLAKSRIALSYIQTKEFDKAVEIYRELVDKIPGSYLLLNNLAYALLSSGNNKTEALEVA
ncbi:MAG: tetratricopeptide repeat protein, partial [Proteobacteria bacterium]|nr:tetratricopeptide repeat protein [Pseudomonadota bacterium]